MVFDAILTSRQTCEKLQCLYENLMSNNFHRTAVLKHNMDCKLKIHFWGFYRKKKWQIYGKSKASLWRNLRRGTPQNFVFFRTAIYRNYWTLDSHTNTVISPTFAHSSRWRRKRRQGLLNWLQHFFVTWNVGCKMGIDVQQMGNTTIPHIVSTSPQDSSSLLGPVYMEVREPR